MVVWTNVQDFCWDEKQDIEGFNVKMNNVFGVDKVDSYKETETYSE